MKIKNVAIFGGNGAVGSQMSAIISGFGQTNVYLICRDTKKLNKMELMDKIFNSIKSDTIKDKIFICNYEQSKEYLPQCDWIFESVLENYEAKKEVLKFINEYANNNTIITTGTSGLSIENLASILDIEKRSRFFGTHFFNPPYHMNLCELIPTQYTDRNVLNDFEIYAKEILLRETVESLDKPAFIANKIGFKTLNSILLLADKYKEERRN